MKVAKVASMLESQSFEDLESRPVYKDYFKRLQRRKKQLNIVTLKDLSKKFK